MTHIHVKSIDAAWREANRIFPTDYIINSKRSAIAGYSIYESTSKDEKYEYHWISDLGNRLEVNMERETVMIWIDEEEIKGMTATVRSTKGTFEEYRLTAIVSVQYIAKSLVLTYMKDGQPQTTLYAADDVIVEIH